MESVVSIPHKLIKQLEHLENTDKRRIADILSKYPNVERKKLWYMGDNVSRVKCGKFRLIIQEARGQTPELVFFGLRNDVYRRVRTTQAC